MGMAGLTSAAIGAAAAASTAFSLYHASPSLPLLVVLTSSCCGTFALAAILLSPVDSLFSAAAAPAALLVGFWRTLYWAALLLGWPVAETLCELVVAGELSRAARLRAAVHAHLRLYCVVLSLLTAAAAYLLIWLHASPLGLESVAALLVNGHGMLVLAHLQGRGMAEVPRRLWRGAEPRASLAQRYVAVSAADAERDATATKLRSLLHKVAAADAAAAPPAARSERERVRWEALHRSTRVAAAECHLDEHEGGRMEWGLRSAWAHTVGTPHAHDDASLARLRRRVRLCGGAARRAWQRRQLALRSAGALSERLLANEKGFGGAGVGRSRGLWLGLLRLPLMRLLALLAAALSAWILLNEACATSRLLPSPLGASLPTRCPAPLLHAALVHHAPVAALAVQLATTGHIVVCAGSTLCASRALAPMTLVPARQTEGASLLRHGSWAVWLAAALAAHVVVLTTSSPEQTALAAALGALWPARDAAPGGVRGGEGAGGESGGGGMGGELGEVGGVERGSGGGVIIEMEPLFYHGLCSALTVATFAGACHECPPLQTLSHPSHDPAPSLWPRPVRPGPYLAPTSYLRHRLMGFVRQVRCSACARHPAASCSA